jgi:hypothetical protein
MSLTQRGAAEGQNEKLGFENRNSAGASAGDFEQTGAARLTKCAGICRYGLTRLRCGLSSSDSNLQISSKKQADHGNKGSSRKA